jgi:hypothetical protein
MIIPKFEGKKKMFWGFLQALSQNWYGRPQKLRKNVIIPMLRKESMKVNVELEVQLHLFSN